MATVTLKCPNCGGSLEFDDSREFGFCQFCGHKLMIQQEIMHIHVSQNFDKQIDRMLAQAEENIRLRKPKDAKKVLKEVIKIDASRPEYYLLSAKAEALDAYMPGDVANPRADRKIADLLDSYTAFSGISISFESLLDELGLSHRDFSDLFRERLSNKEYDRCVKELEGLVSGKNFSLDNFCLYYKLRKELYEFIAENEFSFPKELNGFKYRSDNDWEDIVFDWIDKHKRRENDEDEEFDDGLFDPICL